MSFSVYASTTMTCSMCTSICGCGHTLYEARMRSLSKCLDSSQTKLLSGFLGVRLFPIKNGCGESFLLQAMIYGISTRESFGLCKHITTREWAKTWLKFGFSSWLFDILGGKLSFNMVHIFKLRALPIYSFLKGFHMIFLPLVRENPLRV